jgi:hypothetical protein
MDPVSTQPQELTNVQKVQQWIDHEVAEHGLVDFRFTTRNDIDNALDPMNPKPRISCGIEEFSAELLAMLNAPTVPDPELF